MLVAWGSRDQQNHDHQGDKKIGAGGGGFGVSKAGFEVALETFCHTSDAISLKSEGAIVSIAPKHGHKAGLCSYFLPTRKIPIRPVIFGYWVTHSLPTRANTSMGKYPYPPTHLKSGPSMLWVFW